jgi:hypothetical protein
MTPSWQLPAQQQIVIPGFDSFHMCEKEVYILDWMETVSLVNMISNISLYAYVQKEKFLAGESCR